MHRCRFFIRSLLAAAVAGAVVSGGARIGRVAAAESVDAHDAAWLWSRKVQPLFDVHCVKCHGPIERKSGLELDSPEGVAKGGDEGAVVVAGAPDRSRLYGYLAPDADPHMPPKKQLSEADREWIRRWIAAMGSGAGDAAATRARRTFASVEQAIDTWTAEGWKRAGVEASRGIDDRTWVRRATLDLAGRIPTREEVDAFLAMPEPVRRGRWVERWLASEEYAVRMREMWDVFLMGRTKREAHEGRRRQNGWWTFLDGEFRANRPWDRTVRDLLTARPANPADQGAAWFLYERRNDHQAIAEAVGPLVYGTKIDCAQCHDHPLAREVKQAHYWGLVAAYNRSKNVDGTTEISESAVGGFVNFTNLKKESQPASIALLDGRVVEETRPAADTKEVDRDDLYREAVGKARVPKFSRREAFADAATDGNPYLARAFVNRMWSVLVGRGWVHPADEMTARNVPSHPELLDWLAADFREHGYDVRRLVRGMVSSRVYALGWEAPGTPSPETFASAIERPLTAEQIARSWRVAAGLGPDDDGLRRAVTAAIPDVAPRDYGATFQQAQFLTYSPELAALLTPAPGTTAARLVAISDGPTRIREAFLAVLGREPEGDEIARFDAVLRDRTEPAAAVRDLMWALMTSAEFLAMP
ncbi:MAG: DUF1549 domain-containing protein [Verrucomicrobiales bacterium]|nr:DUF1549 domain-containing protein [Verrucomicrobiales bacterium]